MKASSMKAKTLMIPFALTGIIFTMVSTSEGQKPAPDTEAARIQQGFRIAPVPLRAARLDKNLVGLGSYIVNAQAACNDCHTNPPFAAGGDPYQGQPKRVNAAHYLAGGTSFGPFISPNITPDADGLPAGLTFQEFKSVMRSGHDPDDPGRLLQVMPWPIYREMSDRDLKAIYEYLRAIPHAE